MGVIGELWMLQGNYVYYRGMRVIGELSCAPLGGGAISSPPSCFLAISSKPLQV